MSSWRRDRPLVFPVIQGADIAGKHLDLIGSTQGAREDFARVRDLATSGKIKPVLAGTYPLEDIARAQADFVAKDFIGKLVITTERAK